MKTLSNKNFIIIGDSYSTYEGCIPEGNRTFYSKAGREDKPVAKMEKEDTWWSRLIQETGMNMVLNDSWSGSTISYTGYEGDCSNTNSFIYRFRKFAQEGFFVDKKIDTVFIFGGTNDYWANAPLGEVKTNYTEQDLFCVLPAICCLMKEVRAQFDSAKIYFIINSDLDEKIDFCVKQNASLYGIEYIELENIDKQNKHPTPKGMKSICEQVIKAIQ